MASTFVIKFGKSSSQNYPYAVELASRYDTYEKKGDGKNLVHIVSFSPEQLNDFFELYDLVGRWKSCSIYIDGELVPPSKLSFLWCYRERIKAYDQKAYCYGRDDGHSGNDNDFGCRHSRVDLYGWHGLKGYGEMDRRGVFHVNKDKLRHDVLTNLESYQLCPAFNMETVIKGIDQIPDAIDPRKERDWEYVTDYEDDKVIAVAVRKKEKKRGVVLSKHDYESKINLYEIDSAKKSGKSTGCLVVAIGLPVIIYSLFSLLA